jgi:hypothetical protein
MAAAAIRDTAVLVALTIVTVPGIVASLLARRIFSQSDIPLKEDLRRSILRGYDQHTYIRTPSLKP